jgi:cyclic pyranopterin phosphate synthase
LKAVAGQLIDSHGRILRDLRVSVTDRCNFRCLYCLPESEAAASFHQSRFPAMAEGATRLTRPWQPHGQMLTFEEIERTVRIAVGLGIEKVRLTGGEPLLRPQIEKLVGMIARIPGLRDLAMTSGSASAWIRWTGKITRRSRGATAWAHCWRPSNSPRNWICVRSRSMP